MISSYPPIAVKPWKPFPIRPFLPIYPPPDLVDYPCLPCSPRAQPFSTFSLSTHIVPAVHLRRGPCIPVPDLPTQVTDSLKDEGFEKLREELQRNARDPDVQNSKHEKILWNVVNRYVNHRLAKTANSSGLVLFFAPAGGLPKEIWEPVLARVFSSSVAMMISEVWTWESVQHGDAGLINAKALTGFFDWSDNSRDIVNFLIHFLPSTIPLNEALPLHLARISQEETEQRVLRGFKNRQLILVGHSFSGASLVLGAYHYPHLSSAMILVDPAMVRPGMTEEALVHVRKWNSKSIKSILARKDTWESKEEAYAEFASSPFYAGWDSEMLRAFVEHGLYTTTTTTGTPSRVVNTTTKLAPIHEALVHAGGDAPMEAFACLRDLDERIRLHWIIPAGKNAPEFGPPGAQQERVWVRPKNSSNTRMSQAGHLIPQECVEEFAQDVIEFLQRHYSSHNDIRTSL